MIERIAILDRGAAAVRLIQAVRDLEASGGGRITTIAVHTAADRDARFVREADEALELGPTGCSAHDRVLREARADVVWAGGGVGSAPCPVPAAESGARRIEVQVVADGNGFVRAVGVRDCSVRRAGQVVVAASVAGSRGLRRQAEQHLLAAGLVGVTTVVFHHWPQASTFEFAGIIGGLQDEHAVTELTTQLDLVRLQLASGVGLAGRHVKERGQAIGVRLLAVDPDREFAAAGGRVVLLRLPRGAGIRVDTGVAEGDVIPGADPLVATIVAHGACRDEALARLRRALRETTVVIEGGCTDKTFLMEVLDAEELVSGSADQGWVDGALSEGRLRSARHSGIALIAAAVESHRAGEAIEIVRFMESARAGCPKARELDDRPLELELRGRKHWAQVRRSGPTEYLVAVDGEAAVRVAVDRLGEFGRRIAVDGTAYRLVTAVHGAVRLVEVEGRTHRVTSCEGVALTSPSPALVVGVPAMAGCELAAGAPMVVLESMKMETVLRAPFAGLVKSVLVAPGNQVDAGVPLARLERLDRPSTVMAEPVPAVADEPPKPSDLSDFVEAVELDLDSGLRTGVAEELLYRAFVARQPGSRAAKAAIAVLQSWLASAPVEPAARDLVERVMRWAPGSFPAVMALAWGVHARWFGQLTQLRGLDLWRLSAFETTRLETPADVVLLDCRAKTNPADRRLVAIAETGCAPVEVERAVTISAAVIRATGRPPGSDEIWICVPSIDACADRLDELGERIAPLCAGAGIDEVLIQPLAAFDGEPDLKVIRYLPRTGTTPALAVVPAPSGPVRPLDGYATKVLRSRRRGLTYPYELLELLRGNDGTVTEFDLDETGSLVPVCRQPGSNRAGLIVARVITPTPVYPEGIGRVVLCGDPTMALGAVAEPECARIVAAIDLAEQLALPIEWFALSAGARISMESGTENMDWVAVALRRIIEFTQSGGEINVVVAGINVGAQPYWNAEATMLMHTKGILVMTPDSAMVLTGKESLDFSGAVSAADNFGIGGYDRVMGPNGQAQYWAPDLLAAYRILLRHYEFTTVGPTRDGPRRALTNDPEGRDITQYPHTGPGSDFATVGQIFSPDTNPGRKKPFDIRTVLRAVADQDCLPLERWAGMWDAETAVVYDGRVGGHAVCLLGIESRPLPRRGVRPADGPGGYTAGTLFPRSAKKVARAINAASGNRPLVILANLSGFDGSPDSLRSLQLEYGAEIGRAMVNFRGSVVFCVISRYHGGAFVVFSKRLNPGITVLAVEGSYASVIGGAPAAAVVFAGEVAKRVARDPRLVDLRARSGEAESDRVLAELQGAVRAEKLGEVAQEFDSVHDIHRAVAVGSVDEIVSAKELRPRIIATLSRGLGSMRPQDGVS